MLFLESRKPHLSPYPVRQSNQKKDTGPGLVIHSLAEPGKSLPPSLCLVGYNCTNAKIFMCGSLGWDTGGRGALAHIMSQACEKYGEREDNCKTVAEHHSCFREKK